MNRREFITTTCVGACAAWLLQSCSTHKYISDYSFTTTILTIKKTAFIIIKNGKEIQQRFVLVKPEIFQFPIVIYKLKEEVYKAMFLQCTHQGCELIAYDTMIVCPCHGAEFNVQGEVSQGPAEINLKSFVTTHDSENIYIQF